MGTNLYSVIIGTGSYIPKRRIPNSYFQEHQFIDRNGNSYDKSNAEIIQKFEEITGIKERRYVTDDLMASDIGFFAAEKALESADIDPESLDYIIFAHNFGDVRSDNKRVDMLPSLAARVKHKLKIKNPGCVAYDLPFGCPGWLQGVIQADYYLKSGDARRALVIGGETLSRICDPYDRDSMIYSDGAGATILEATESEKPVGILNHATRSDTASEAWLLSMGPADYTDDDDTLYLKMNGHKLYVYALTNVPGVVKKSIDESGLDIGDISKVLIHQANEKMDEAIMQRVFKMYGKAPMPDGVMPMTISWLGNSSVATIPTLLDLIQRGEIDGHALESGKNMVFASVGAGMNINALVYRMP